MPPRAFLLVFSDPGPNVDEAEYHDWYDNEHIPLRVNTPTFLDWTRWEAVDGQYPRFGASYDLESYEATKHAPYTTLSQTRSERESNLISKIGTLDRRHYELYEGHPPGPYAAFVEVDVKPEFEADFNKWVDEVHFPLIAKVPGWVRGRRFVLKDAGQLGNEGKDKPPPPKYLAVHEWQSLEALESEELKAVLSASWQHAEEGQLAHEYRLMKFLKSWERK
ncbi:hypothetical protein B0H21DRAFT_776307 [Amylocystis lapponica]|nr:hypothetical protein B0H21DRAFT_776307 [Amylocystis lapponica]